MSLTLKAASRYDILEYATLPAPIEFCTFFCRSLLLPTTIKPIVFSPNGETAQFWQQCTAKGGRSNQSTCCQLSAIVVFCPTVVGAKFLQKPDGISITIHSLNHMAPPQQIHYTPTHTCIAISDVSYTYTYTRGTHHNTTNHPLIPLFAKKQFHLQWFPKKQSICHVHMMLRLYHIYSMIYLFTSSQSFHFIFTNLCNRASEFWVFIMQTSGCCVSPRLVVKYL